MNADDKHTPLKNTGSARLLELMESAGVLLAQFDQALRYDDVPFEQLLEILRMQPELKDFHRLLDDVLFNRARLN